MRMIGQAAAELAMFQQRLVSDAPELGSLARLRRSTVASRSKVNRELVSTALLVPVLLVGSLLTEWTWARATSQELTVRFNVITAAFALLFALTVPSALLYLQLILRPRGPRLAIVIGLMTALVAAIPFVTDVVKSLPNVALASALGVEVVAASVALHYLRIAIGDDDDSTSS